MSSGEKMAAVDREKDVDWDQLRVGLTTPSSNLTAKPIISHDTSPLGNESEDIQAYPGWRDSRIPSRGGFSFWAAAKRAVAATGSSGEADTAPERARMSTWSGQPKVEGSSETVRMVLLTCVSIGITSVCHGL